jgi:Uma2 family endonuclease
MHAEPLDLLETIYLPSGEIVAENVSAADYMEHYAADHHEWVRGHVIKLSPVQLYHDGLTGFLLTLLNTYFFYRPIGTTLHDPFVMVLSNDVRREPDLMIVLNEHAERIQPTYIKGAADICIEVVSPESRTRDAREKRHEYEAAGVREYWLLDYPERDAQFLRLNAQGLYDVHRADEHGHYTSPLLPGLVVHVPDLWRESFPLPPTIVENVKAMLDIA